MRVRSCEGKLLYAFVFQPLANSLECSYLMCPISDRLNELATSIVIN